MKFSELLCISVIKSDVKIVRDLENTQNKEHCLALYVLLASVLDMMRVASYYYR